MAEARLRIIRNRLVPFAGVGRDRVGVMLISSEASEITNKYVIAPILLCAGRAPAIMRVSCNRSILRIVRKLAVTKKTGTGERNNSYENKGIIALFALLYSLAYAAQKDLCA